jgi:hypothetical protein
MMRYYTDDKDGYYIAENPLPSWTEISKADYDAANQVIETPEQIKLKLRTKVNEKRNWYEVAGFPYMGKVFDSDPRSFYRITTANDAAFKDPSFSIEWTVADNTKLAMNAQEMLGVMPALAGYGQLIFNNSVALKAAIEAAETVEELQDIDIDSGWPDLTDYL